MLTLESVPSYLSKEFAKLNLGIVNNTKVVAMEVDSTLKQEIREDSRGQAVNQRRQSSTHPGRRARYSMAEATYWILSISVKLYLEKLMIQRTPFVGVFYGNTIYGAGRQISS